MLAALLLSLALVQAPGGQAPSSARFEEVRLRGLDGQVVRPADLGGRVVLIDVWATWCAPCLAELPTLRQLERAYPEDLVIVGINLDTMTRRDFVSWLRRHDVTWFQHFDGRGYASPVAMELDVNALPVSLLLDRNGRIAARDLRGPALVATVEALVRSGNRR